jgi:hypothetical protein
VKIVVALLATVILGFFAFQNCQKAPHADDISNDSNVSSINSTNKVDLAGQKISEISFLIQEDETIARASGSYELVVNKTLKINLNTGALTVVSDTNPTPTNLCL